MDVVQVVFSSLECCHFALDRDVCGLIPENRDVRCEGVHCLVLYVAEKADGWLVKLWE